jgi:hypothetical protein
MSNERDSILEIRARVNADDATTGVSNQFESQNSNADFRLGSPDKTIAVFELCNRLVRADEYPIHGFGGLLCAFLSERFDKRVHFDMVAHLGVRFP